jgi:Flp pilus assembly protein TadG
MALTIPILLSIFTGAASFSMGFYKMQQLGYATAAATQQVSSLAGETTDPCAQIVTTVTASLPGWSSSSLNYKAVITDSTGTAHTYPSTGMTGNTFSCTAAATLMGANEPIVVTVSYGYNWFPILQFTQSGSLYSTEAGLME